MLFIKYDQGSTSIPFNEKRFYKKFRPFEGIHCAEFDPPAEFLDGGKAEVIYLHDLEVVDNRTVSIAIGAYRFEIVLNPQCDHTILTLIEAVPRMDYPLRVCKLSDRKAIQLFRLTDHKPLASILCYREDLVKKVKKALGGAAIDWESIVLRVGTEEERFISARVEVDELLQGLIPDKPCLFIFVQAKNELTFVSDNQVYSTEVLSQLSKATIHYALSRDPDFKRTLTCSMIKVALSGGFPRSLVNQSLPSNLHFGGLDIDFSAAHVHINGEAAMQEFAVSSRSMRIGCDFWTMSLAESFSLADGAVDLAFGWQASSLSRDPDRKVDAAVLLKSQSPLPVLIVEKGDRGCELEDDGCARVSALMVAACEAQMRELLKRDLSPETARCYGMVVNGNSARFITAHAVRMNDWEVVVNSNEEWLIDLVDGTGGQTSVVLNATSPPHSSTESDEGLSTVLNATAPPFLPDLIELDDANPVTAPVESALNCRNGPSVKALQSLKFLFDLVKTHTTQLHQQMECTMVVDSCGLAKQPLKYIPLSLKDSQIRAPHRKLIQSARSCALSLMNYSALHQDDAFQITKQYSPHELTIYRQSTAFHPGIFARTFAIDVDEDESAITYRFEALDAFVNEDNHYQRNPDIFNTDDRIFVAVRLSLDLLVGLYVLHRQLGYLHRDVSPVNIMYSRYDRCWKLNDFNRSIPITPSPNERERGVVGTIGFTDPRVYSGAAYTEASDLYSLGCVLKKYLLAYVRASPISLEWAKAEDVSAVEGAVRMFCELVEGLTEDDPGERVSHEGAIEMMLQASLSISPGYSNQFLRAAQEILHQ